MQLNSEIITTPPRASATVVLLRLKPQNAWANTMICRMMRSSAVCDLPRLCFVARRVEPPTGFEEFLWV
jgi:hypothetical protein